MKGRRVNAVVPIASIILSLLAIEVGLRAYTGRWEYDNLRDPSKADYIFSTPVSFDAKLGWVPRGDAQAKNTILDDGTRSNSS